MLAFALFTLGSRLGATGWWVNCIDACPFAVAVCCAAAMAFSPCGTLLAIVCADNRHTLTIWDVSKPRAVQITPAKPAFNGQPPQVLC